MSSYQQIYILLAGSKAGQQNIVLSFLTLTIIAIKIVNNNFSPLLTVFNLPKMEVKSELVSFGIQGHEIKIHETIKNNKKKTFDVKKEIILQTYT